MNDHDIKNKIREKAESLEIPESVEPEKIKSNLKNKKAQVPLKQKPLFFIAAVLGAAGMIALGAGLPGFLPAFKRQIPIEPASVSASVEEDIAEFEEMAKEKDVAEFTYHEIYTALASYQKEEERYYKETAMTGESSIAEGSFIEESVNDAAKDSSTTNSQVSGVDEGDIVKTDGDYIYILSSDRQSLHILSAKGTDITPSSLIEVEKPAGDYYLSQNFKEFYLGDNQLVLIFETWSDSHEKENGSDDSKASYDVFYYDNVTTSISVYDISDRSAPHLQNTISQDGSYNTSRKNGDFIYLFSYFTPYLEKGADMPEYYIPSVGGEILPAQCIRIPEYMNSTGYMVISSLNILQPDKPVSSEAILSTSSSFYVSTGNIYITAADYNRMKESEIIKYSYENGMITHKGTAKIPGSLNNQFSLDEYKGNLRLVTTLYESEENNTSKIWGGSQQSSNSLYILDENLNTIGKIENLAPGELIYSARFMGDTGYFVTFRQMDPLFSADLSDPRNPKILGELKITGFSNYLHFYGENLLLGIGYEADEHTGSSTGVKLSMFDISDPSDVTEIHKKVIPNAYLSYVGYNHKAILISPDTNLFGFQIEEEKNMGRYHEFIPYYYVFSYDRQQGFSTNLSHELNEDPAGGYSPDARGIYIGNYLYIIENAYQVSVYDVHDYTLLKNWRSGELPDD